MPKSGMRLGAALDRELFDRFYHHVAGGLWRYIYLNCGDATAADDILQESFIKFLRYADPEREVAEWKSYLYRIAASSVVAHFRKNGRYTDSLPETETISDSSDGDLQMDMKMCLNELDPRHREILWLAHVEGFSHYEIAGIVGVAESSVRVLLHRARGRLKDLLVKRGVMMEEFS